METSLSINEAIYGNFIGVLLKRLFFPLYNKYPPIVAIFKVSQFNLTPYSIGIVFNPKGTSLEKVLLIEIGLSIFNEIGFVLEEISPSHPAKIDLLFGKAVNEIVVPDGY
jgi:hypothetical protein